MKLMKLITMLDINYHVFHILRIPGGQKHLKSMQYMLKPVETMQWNGVNKCRFHQMWKPWSSSNSHGPMVCCRWNNCCDKSLTWFWCSLLYLQLILCWIPAKFCRIGVCFQYIWNDVPQAAWGIQYHPILCSWMNRHMRENLSTTVNFSQLPGEGP